jgi:hypothetical protein
MLYLCASVLQWSCNAGAALCQRGSLAHAVDMVYPYTGCTVYMVLIHGFSVYAMRDTMHVVYRVHAYSSRIHVYPRVLYMRDATEARHTRDGEDGGGMEAP